MDNRITRRSNNPLRSRNTSKEVKYRVGMTASLLLVALAGFFDLMELALSLLSAGFGGYVKDFASIVVFPFLFWALGVPFWKGNKKIQKIITIITGFIISFIPYLSDILPELAISVIATLLFTRMEDRIKHFKNKRLDSSIRSRRGLPDSYSEEDEEDEELVSDTVTRFRRDPVRAPSSFPTRNVLQNPSVRNVPPLRQTPSMGNSRPQQALAGSSDMGGGLDSSPNASRGNNPVQTNPIPARNPGLNSSGINIPPMRRVINPSSSVSMSPGVSVQDVANSANYQGDWTLLLRDRMLDPVTKQKFIDTRTEAMPAMRQGTPPPAASSSTPPQVSITSSMPFDISKIKISKVDPNQYAAHYEEQIRDYDKNVKKVFDSTVTVPAKEIGNEPKHLGISPEMGHPGVVFTDAMKDGKNISIRHKNIIEAHEKGHSLRNFTSPKDISDFRGVLDIDALSEISEQRQQQGGERAAMKYLQNPMEIAERMSQLKSYYGFKGNEIFTQTHLDHAKKNYLKDVGLDNNMSDFLGAITPKTQAKFLETINKYPI